MLRKKQVTSEILTFESNKNFILDLTLKVSSKTNSKRCLPGSVAPTVSEKFIFKFFFYLSLQHKPSLPVHDSTSLWQALNVTKIVLKQQQQATTTTKSFHGRTAVFFSFNFYFVGYKLPCESHVIKEKYLTQLMSCASVECSTWSEKSFKFLFVRLFFFWKNYFSSTLTS